MLSSRHVADGSGPATSRSSLGGLFKRLSPTYRSRSKSPMFHIVNQIGETEINGEKKTSSSWVTVELKGQTLANSQKLTVARRASGIEQDGLLMSVSAKTKNVLPLSPMSTSMIECGSTAVDPADLSARDICSSSQGLTSPSKTKSSFGSFLRHSLRRSRKRASAPKSLDINGSLVIDRSLRVVDSIMSSPTCGASLTKSSVSTTPRSKAALSAKQKFDDFLAVLAGTASPRRRRRIGINSGIDAEDVALSSKPAARVAVSEENVVSEVLNSDKSIFIGRTGDDSTPNESKDDSQGHLPATLLCTPTPFFYSQSNVFEENSSITPISPSLRLPSYVRLSCMLSGYKNYRAIDLKAATTAAVLSPRLDMSNDSIGVGDSCQLSTEERQPTINSADDVDREQDGHHCNSQIDYNALCDTVDLTQVLPRLPLGKSIVERRLEVFDLPPANRLSKKLSLHGHSPTTYPSTKTSTIHQQTSATSLPLDSSISDSGTPSVPVRRLINNFNKMTPPVVPPKQKLSSVSKSHCNLTNVEPVVPDVNYQPTVGVPSYVETQLTDLMNGLRIDSPTTVNNLDSGTVNGADSTDRSVVGDLENNMQAQFLHNGCVGEKIDRNQATARELTNGAQEPQLANCHDFSKVRESNWRSSYNLMPNMAGNGCPVNSELADDVMDGKFYLAQAQRERVRLENLAKAAEQELYVETLPEHDADEVRTGIGKVNLLLRKKFTMFENLINKNLNPIPDDPCPAFNSDLDGYWQLVKLELADIDSNFDRIHKMRCNGWAKICCTDKPTCNTPKQFSKLNASMSKKNDIPSNNHNIKARLRQEARKKLNEAKLAGLERKKMQSATGENGFFVI